MRLINRKIVVHRSSGWGEAIVDNRDARFAGRGGVGYCGL